MHRRDHLRVIGLFGLVLSFAGILPAQNAPDTASKTLVVNGKTVGAPVTQINGHSYVDIETLAQITNGVVTVEPNRIVLTMPSPGARPDAAPPQAAQGFSKDFVRVSVADVAEMREWRGAVGTMITYGLAVSGTWSQTYHDSVAEGLTQATLVASTEADRSALALLQSEFDKLTVWAADAFAARQALNGEKTIDPNALQNDQALAKIRDCGQFLNAMLVSGAFGENASCH